MGKEALASHAQMACKRPFEWLLELERRGHAHRGALPSRERSPDEWRGVGFRLGEQQLIASMDEVIEVLSLPGVARIPHAERWLRGVANVRGNLLPLIDLSDYLGKGPTQITRLSRVLVIEQHAVYAGLLVDELLGMRRFLYSEQWRALVNSGDQAMRAYLNGVLRRDDSDWLVFSMAALTRELAFIKAAA